MIPNKFNLWVGQNLVVNCFQNCIFTYDSQPCFGIYSTVKRKGWKSFRSTKLFNLVVKSFFYLVSIILAFLVDTYVFQSKLFGVDCLASKSMALVWIYVEIKSIDETSVGLGNKSIWVILKEMIAKAAEFKKDLKSVDNE